MSTVGVIVEYNPLHYGHVYHFRQSLNLTGADTCVAVMSGHFLQRGEPALAGKWARAEMALRMGADLVIELPVAYSSQPAEWFAFGACALLDATGVVDSLCFGSESGELGWLLPLARVLADEPEAFRAQVKAGMAKGMNYPAAYSAAAASLARDLGGRGAAAFADVAPEALGQPNNTLGLHYLIALERLGSSIAPYTVARRAAGYHQADVTDAQIASATAIRRLLFEQGDLAAAQAYLPPYTYDVLQREWAAGRGPQRWSRYTPQLLHQLVSRTADELAELAEVTEGLQHRLKGALPRLGDGPLDFERLLAALKTKRYTRTKLQRMLTRILLGHSKSALSAHNLREGVSYIRVLGFTERGRALLKRMKTTAKLPVVTKVTKESFPFLDMDIRATSAYALGFDKPASEDLLRDYYQSPIIISSERYERS
ncbi:nucleotidyltransferase [Paenibacillus swuensis]|uniref:tRNA(Met) cytidine acetate ligase n=1 Tax=Paenibacillus swuensis TaxID=1178515 RepID=A0A172TL50_9BACL|nr:nucleotidyltransferase [Paenibacillus swuensis]ANE47503.1 nucleotidyltransferase [Paenibacillus swuensis]